MNKPLIFLPGASGSMGFETFKLLWDQRDRYDIVLLQRPSKKNRRLFKPFIRKAGATPVDGGRVLKGKGLKIIWGDAASRENIIEACQGIDWCLNCMALISPEADRRPEEAEKINTIAIRHIVEAIEAQDPEHIRLVYVGSIAEYGDRLPPIHTGRVGDPILPSKFDMYARSKIHGEIAVMESKIRHWVSLRQTFIMIPDLFSLMDPIMFHQPVNSYMENITARDSARAMVACLDIPGDSDFWRQCFNLSGGPECRTVFLSFLDRIYDMIGINYMRAMNRNWFALKNFHMQFFEDADRLNAYTHHWEGGESMEDYFKAVYKAFPWYLKFVSWLKRDLPLIRWIIDKGTFLQLRSLSRKKPDGTMHWIYSGQEEKINAFFGSLEKWKEIPGWSRDMPVMDLNIPFRRLDHGYEEGAQQLSQADLEAAATFRGGILLSEPWDGDIFTPLQWKCCRDHTFTMKPNTVLKAGHWCPDCVGPPWAYEEIVEKAPFFRQVFEPGARSQ